MLAINENGRRQRKPACGQCDSTGYVYLWSVSPSGSREWSCDRSRCKRSWTEAKPIVAAAMKEVVEHEGKPLTDRLIIDGLNDKGMHIARRMPYGLQIPHGPRDCPQPVTLARVPASNQAHQYASPYCAGIRYYCAGTRYCAGTQPSCPLSPRTRTHSGA